MPHSTNIVAICVATYMRPLLLKNCLYSLTKIIVPKKYTPIIIVVDNDILRSSEASIPNTKVVATFVNGELVYNRRYN